MAIGTITPPEKADAAAQPKVSATYDGLCEALNSFQRDLVTKKIFQSADEYSVEFNPPELGQALCNAKGLVDHNRVAMAPQNLQTNPNAQAVDTNSFTLSTHPGMQITQFIDQIMRNSTYVYNQALVNYNQQTDDEVPGKNNKPLIWYKINFSATPKEYDSKRNDWSYKVKYIITPYKLVAMNSQYFNPGEFRGVHKKYDYWFTGLNNSILQFEQDYNYLYRNVTSGANIGTDERKSNSFELFKNVYQPFSAQTSQGRDGRVNEPGANAANYLFTQADMAVIKIKIVGDPAWMQQAEASGVTEESILNSSPFNDDGTINFDANQICFSINWNAPQDYNLDNGLVYPLGARGGVVQAYSKENFNKQVQDYRTRLKEKQTDVSVVYICNKVRSSFSRGSFTQEIEGKLYVEADNKEFQNAQPKINESSNVNVTPVANDQSAVAAATKLRAENEAIQSGIVGQVTSTTERLQSYVQAAKQLLPNAASSITGAGVEWVKTATNDATNAAISATDNLLRTVRDE